MHKTVWLLCISMIMFFSVTALAQSPNSVGAFVGKVIPDGPDGVTEIFGVGGVRYSTSGTGNSQFDMGAIFGAAGHTLWHDLFINTRYNMKSQGFRNHVGVGADLLRYRSGMEQTDESDVLIVDSSGNPVLREETKTTMGLYILGGLTAEIINPINMRADMKLNVIPDLILTISLGLEWRFGDLKKE